jgi:hypothetical protein
VEEDDDDDEGVEEDEDDDVVGASGDVVDPRAVVVVVVELNLGGHVGIIVARHVAVEGTDENDSVLPIMPATATRTSNAIVLRAKMYLGW